MSTPEAPDPAGYPEAYDVEEPASGLPAFVRDPKGILRRRWRWMLLALSLGAAATAAALVLVKPLYSAKATVLVTSQRISKEFVASTVDSDEFERINAIVGELFSRRHLSGLVQEHDLYAGGDETLSMEQRVARLRMNASIDPEEGIGRRERGDEAKIYSVTFRHTDPEVAASVATTLAKRFTEAHLRMRTRQVSVATDFLRRELERAERELREHEQRITEFKQTNRGELPGELDANLNKLERLQQQRQSLALQIADAETRLAMLVSGTGERPDESPEARLAALRARLESELAVRTEEHPTVISLKRQVKSLEEQLGGTDRSASAPTRPTLAAAAQSTLRELRRQLDQTERAIEELDVRVARTPEREEELGALLQRETVLQENYVSALRKVKQAELAEAVDLAQQGERATILDRAVPPRTAEPSLLLLLAAGVLGSLGLAVGTALLWELLDPVLLHADQIESEFGVPVVGSVAHIG